VLYHAAAEKDHRIMLSTFPKVTLRVYERAMLVHVPELLKQGTLLDGGSWFLEAFSKVWKSQLKFHTNDGGGVKKAELMGQGSVEGLAFKEAIIVLTIWTSKPLKRKWATSMPLLHENEFWDRLQS
jgi:hypothetical protein